MITHIILLKPLLSQELFLYLKNLLEIMRLKFTEETKDIQVSNIIF